MPSYWPSGGAGNITVTPPITSTGGNAPDIGIDNFTGDSGTGGAAGAVPAPAAGDAAAKKFLAADGTWKNVATTDINIVTASAALTNGMPVIGSGVNARDVIVGTKSGNTNQFATAANSAKTAGHLATWDATGNLADGGAPATGSVTSVGATAPVTSTGGATPVIAINNFTGDSGAGGAKGAVPAPAAGDAAAGKFLAAGGGWSVPAGAGNLTVSGMYLYDGSSYYVGPVNQVATLPVAGNFAWINQGGASEATVQNALVMTAPYVAGTNWRIRKKSIGANTVLTACIIPTMEMQNFRFGAILWRESATGRVICFGWTNQTNPVLQVTRYSSPTAFSSSPYVGANIGIPNLMWLRLEISGANLNYYYSRDGVNYVKVYTETKAGFFTTGPDEWGYGLDTESGSAGQSSDAYITLLSFKEQ